MQRINGRWNKHHFKIFSCYLMIQKYFTFTRKIIEPCDQMCIIIFSNLVCSSWCRHVRSGSRFHLFWHLVFSSIIGEKDSLEYTWIQVENVGPWLLSLGFASSNSSISTHSRKILRESVSSFLMGVRRFCIRRYFAFYNKFLSSGCFFWKTSKQVKKHSIPQFLSML